MSKWILVESSALKAVRYDNTERWLDVELTSGKKYRYWNVSYTEFSDILTGGKSGSSGREYNNMKLRHEAEVCELKEDTASWVRTQSIS